MTDLELYKKSLKMRHDFVHVDSREGMGAIMYAAISLVLFACLLGVCMWVGKP